MSKKLSKAQLTGVIIAGVSVLLLIGGVTAFFLTRPSGSKEETETTAPSRVAAASPDQANGSKNPIITDLDNPGGTASSESASHDPSEPSDNDTSVSATDAPLPSAMQGLLSEGGCSAGELSEYGANQLIIVDSSGSSAEITFYEHAQGTWTQDDSLTCYGFVGSNGTTSAMAEGTAGTPQGLYSVGEAFYQNSPPETGLEVFHITSDTYWVDDPDSPNYNQRVVGDDALNGAHAEHMAEISTYAYGFVINYNIPPTGYGRGSAIFFHCSSGSPTLGCVSASEDMVLAYLARLDASQNPYILII